MSIFTDEEGECKDIFGGLGSIDFISIIKAEERKNLQKTRYLWEQVDVQPRNIKSWDLLFEKCFPNTFWLKMMADKKMNHCLSFD